MRSTPAAERGYDRDDGDDDDDVDDAGGDGAMSGRPP